MKEKIIEHAKEMFRDNIIDAEAYHWWVLFAEKQSRRTMKEKICPECGRKMREVIEEDK